MVSGVKSTLYKLGRYGSSGLSASAIKFGNTYFCLEVSDLCLWLFTLHDYKDSTRMHWAVHYLVMWTFNIHLSMLVLRKNWAIVGLGNPVSGNMSGDLVHKLYAHTIMFRYRYLSWETSNILKTHSRFLPQGYNQKCSLRSFHLSPIYMLSRFCRCSKHRATIPHGTDAMASVWPLISYDVDPLNHAWCG